MKRVKNCLRIGQWEEECEEEGIDYDDHIDKFYDEVNETISIMLDLV